MKTDRIYLRITEEEKKKISEAAKSKGLSLSSYCIMKALEECSSNDNNYIYKESVDIHIKLDREILKKIDTNARKSLMSRSAYIAKAVISNTIIIDGLKDFTKEINRLGSNINQIVMLANQGIMKTVDFGEFNELIAKVISYLIEIKGGQERAYNRKGGRKEREKR